MMRPRHPNFKQFRVEKQAYIVKPGFWI